MKRFFMRWYLLNKRLFKTPVFIVILCAVPVLILALNAVTRNTDGFIRIAVVAEDPDDETSAGIVDKLIDSSGIVKFTVMENEKDAEDCVRYGELNGAWIISADVKEAISDFVRGRIGEKCVKVIEREDTVSLSLAREKLAAALSYDMCLELMREDYRDLVAEDLDDDELRGFFDDAVAVGELFEFRHVSGELTDYSGTSFIMLPIRGVLAAAILLCGFAMAMFRIRDEKKMVFCRVSSSARPSFELGYHLTGIIDIAAAVLISLYTAGLGESVVRELASMAVYCLNCAVFAIFFRRLLRSTGGVAAAAPLVTVLVVVVNPVLLNLPYVYPLRVLTPMFYYLQSTHDASFILYGLLYFVILAGVDYALYRVSEKYDLRVS